MSNIFEGKKILIVEDDPPLREMFAKILTASGAEVRHAENGLVAKTVLDLNKNHFDLVASDVKMPQMDGIQLLKHTKENYPNIRFLMFTGFSEIMEAQQAFELGADGFLAKPFKASELKNTIEQIFAPPPEETLMPPEQKKDDSTQFCKIHVDEFLSASKLLSDIYVRVADSKFIKVAHGGSEIQVERIQTYKNKRVDFFYVRTEDFHKYVGFNLNLAHKVENSNKISPDKKMKLYKHTTEILVQKIFLSGMDKIVCEEAETLIKNTLNIIGESSNLFDLLSVLQTRGDHLYAHSLAVSIYSCLIAKKIGWQAAQTQYKLSIAGLYHDIGFKELPIDLISKSRFQMSAEEVALFETHAIRGRDILLAQRDFPGDLAQIVFQHHENQCGGGYPQHLHSIKTHPLAKLIRLADEFCTRSHEISCTSVSEAQQVVQSIYDTKPSDFDSQFLAALFQVFEMPIPTSLIRSKAA